MMARTCGPNWFSFGVVEPVGVNQLHGELVIAITCGFEEEALLPAVEFVKSVDRQLWPLLERASGGRVVKLKVCRFGGLLGQRVGVEWNAEGPVRPVVRLKPAERPAVLRTLPTTPVRTPRPARR